MQSESVAVTRSISAGQSYGRPVVLIFAVALALRACGLFQSSIDADEGVYIVMAQQWLRGGLPYVAVWDQHPPGLPALFALVQLFIPDPVLGARLAAALAATATAILIHRFCLRHAGQPAAGLLGALLYLVCISRWAGLSANTEIFNNTIVTLAAYLLFSAARRAPDLRRAVAAALVFGIGLQIKYVIFPEAALLSLGYLAASYRRRPGIRSIAVAAASMIAAGCLPTALAIAYFWSQGALQPFLDANIGSNLTYISILPPLREVVRDSASGLLPLMGPLLLLCYALQRQPRRYLRDVVASPLQAWVLLWIGAAMLDVCLPMKFFRHYFFAFYPPVCLGAGLALASMVTPQHRKRAAAAALLLVALPVWAMGVVRATPWANDDTPRAIAKLVQEAGAGDGDVYVYRYQPVIYALAQIAPPTPYVMTLELSEFSRSSHANGAAEIARVMALSPRFVVLPVRTHDQWTTGPVDRLLARSLTGYHVMEVFADHSDRSVIRVYER